MTTKKNFDSNLIYKLKNDINDELLNKENGLLFDFNNEIFNSNVVICDMEMNGDRYKPEIVEFAGVKVFQGKIIGEIIYFEFKPIKRKINKSAENVLGRGNDYYSNKKPISEYFPIIHNFINKSILCLYAPYYDMKSLSLLYSQMKHKIEKFKIIDIQDLVFKVENSIRKKYMKADWNKQDKKSLDKISEKLTKKYSLNEYNHNALIDTFKSILVLKELNCILNFEKYNSKQLYWKRYKKN